jgi:hypothetical protein
MEIISLYTPNTMTQQSANTGTTMNEGTRVLDVRIDTTEQDISETLRPNDSLSLILPLTPATINK